MTMDSPADGVTSRALLFSLVGALLIWRIVFALLPAYSPVLVEISRPASAAVFQIFHKPALADSYHPSNVLTFESGVEHSAVLLPPVKIGVLRFDPLTEPGEEKINSICLTRSMPTTKRCWAGEEIARDFIARDHITEFRARDGAVEIKNIGTDPFFETRPELEPFLQQFSYRGTTMPWIVTAALVTALFFASRFILLNAGNGKPAFSAPRLLISVSLAVLLTTAFCKMTAGIRAVTPPLQGADEIDHVGKLIAAERGEPCGAAPLALVQAWGRLSHLAHHPEARWTGTPVEITAADAPLELENPTCRYGAAYLALPRLINALRGNHFDPATLGAYLDTTRKSTSESAYLLFAVSFLIVGFGRPLRARGESAVFASRAAGLFAAAYTIFLPQTLWISSTLNADAFLIAGGLALAVSTMFRIRVISDMIIAGALLAGADKVVYLPPFLFLAAVHYFGAFRPLFPARFGLRLYAAGLLLGIAGFFTARVAAGAYCESNYCYGLERSGFITSFTAFRAEVALMFEKYSVLLWPSAFHDESAFGNFGWLDTPMPSSAASLYAAPAMWLLCCSAFVGVGAVVLRKFSAHVQATVGHWAALGSAYWLLSFAAVYVIFWLMAAWCGVTGELGCAYQRRYELPLYPFLILLLFSAGFHAAGFAGRNVAEKRALQILLALLLFAGEGAVIAKSAAEQLAVISARYFRTSP